MNLFGFDDDGFAPFPGQRAARPGAFTRRYRCYPVSFIDRAELEEGDKIILPPSALDMLTRLNITYPMLFRIEAGESLATHCGVLEFLADEGLAYLPFWMMQNLCVEEGAIITVRNVQLQKGTFVKFQPQTPDFLAISNPKSVLERTLRAFTCLSKGQSLPISYNAKRYWLEVLDTQPGDAISIIETDVNVDFAPPPGYDEPAAAPSAPSSSAAGSLANGGGQIAFGGDANAGTAAAAAAAAASKPTVKRAGRRAASDSDSDSDPQSTAAAKPRFPGQGHALRRSGGRAFIPTSGATGGRPDADAEAKSAARDDGGAGFTAFSGVGRSLRGATVDGSAGASAPPSEPLSSTTTTTSTSNAAPAPATAGDREEKADAPPSGFIPFAGTGRRLRD